MLTKKEKKELKNEYYSKSDVIQVLGCLIQEPDLLQNREYKLTSDDFIESFHNNIYKAIYNLNIDGLKNIDGVAIKDYLNRVDETAHRIVFEVNEGVKFIQMVKNFAKIDNFSYHYKRVKKFSLLRDMIEDDIDVTTILDKSGVLEKEEVREQEVEFDKWELSDIIEELLDYKSNMYRDKYHTEEEIEYQTSGENMHEILDLYRQGDNYGLISQGKFYTAITLGNKRGTIELLSSVSGGGKSRRIIGKLTSLIAPELWDYNKEEFVPNINNPNNELSAVYIGSELDLSNEVKPIALATICGLETSQIKDYNNLTEEEEERIEKGIEIMDKMKLHLYSLLNYDIATIVRLVKKHQRNENVYALGFDYIEKTSNIVNEYKETYSSQFVPSHELYLYISKSLKERVAKKLDIYVVTATQLNAKSESNEHQVSSAMIRGSYALIDKFDIGCITLFIKPEELKVYESFLTTRRGFDRESLRPNMVSYVFKNRNGVYVLIKIFQCVNLGNMRTRDLLITNYHNEIINIEGVEKEDLTYEDLEKMNAEINKKATVGGINGVIGDFAEDVM